MFNGRPGGFCDGSRVSKESVQGGARMHRALLSESRPLTFALERCSH